jgi:hypothetical protein
MRSWYLNRRLGDCLVVLVALGWAGGAIAQEPDLPDDIIISAPSAPDLPISLEGVSKGQGEGCMSLCMQILIKTARPVVIDGLLYRRLEGTACNMPEHAESVRTFVLAGFLGVCAERVAAVGPDDGIFVRVIRSDWSTSEPLPRPTFDGFTMQAIERRHGTERILGQRTSGYVATPSRLSSLGFTTKRVGKRFSEAEFLQQLLGVPIVQRFNNNRIARDASLEALITALVPQLDLPDQQKAAVAAIAGLAKGLEYGDRTALTALLLDLLRSGSKGRLMAAFGMMEAMSGWGLVERDAARPVIVATLQSEDVELVASALGALRGYPQTDRAFANPQLIALAFSPVLRDEGNSVHIRLVLYLGRMNEDVPPADRKRAEDLLLKGSLTKSQVISLLAVLAHGGGPARTEAFTVLQRLDQLAFEQGAAHIGILGWKSFAGDPGRFWSNAELEVLFSRMESVPDERLDAYVGAFGGSSTSKETRRKVADHVRARLAAAEAAGADFEATKPLRKAATRMHDL